MRNRDPYVPVRDTPRVLEFQSQCRDCPRIFTERPGDGCEGYCPICVDESDRLLSGQSY